MHPPWYLDRLRAMAEAGGGWIDADTRLSTHSAEAAELAVGAGLTAVRALRAGTGSAAFCAVRPPGHHATPTDSMGFCLLSNVAIVAATLAAEGERVWVFDYDAHHGNGTQAAFVDDPRVLFVSMHQWPLYPGTGRVTETGTGAGRGTTMNIPLPPGATGDVYLRAFDDVVAPVVERFAPTWLLISAGFDAHRDDPLTELGLTAGDFGLLTARALPFVGPGGAWRCWKAATTSTPCRRARQPVLSTLAGAPVAPERPSAGGPGAEAVVDARSVWSRLDVVITIVR